MDEKDLVLRQTAQGKGIGSIGKTEFLTRRVLRGHFGKVYASAWARDSTYLVSASQDGKLIVWNVTTGLKVYAISLRSSWVMATDFSPSGRFVAAGGLDNMGSIYPVNLESNEVVARDSNPVELVGHEGYVSSCTFVDDSTILTTSGDATVMLWDVEKQTSKQKFLDHKADVMTASFMGSSRDVFITGSCDASIKVWDVRNGQNCLRSYEYHESDVNSVQSFSNGTTFVSGSDDSKCMLFDIRTKQKLNEYHSDRILCGVTSVDSSKSGRYIFAAYDEGVVRVWDTLHASTTQELATDSRPSSVRVAPNGESVITASWDNLLRVWA